MNIRQKIVGCVLLGILFFIIIFAREVEGAPRTISSSQGSQTWDLEVMEQRAEFRAMYGDQLGICFAKADFVVDLMEQRDAGSTEQEHLDLMRSNYEASKTGGGKPIAHHVYVDFQRMVRDLHRSGREGYAVTDPGKLWEREVWWCVLPGR